MNFRTPIFAALLTGIALSAGCRNEAAPTKPAAFTGRTDSMVTVVQAINQNNAQLPTVWASHYYEVDIVDPKTKVRNKVNGSGALLYRQPMGFRLVGKKDLLGDVFEVGSTDEYYWLKLVPETDTMWFGEHKNIGKPCVQSLPIQPNLVMQVLGIGLIGTDFTQMPTPVMRYNPDTDAYMFVWVSSVGGANAGPQRLAAQREVWYDRATKLPTLVILFDPDGRPVLRAKLGRHQAVQVADAQAADGPKIATDYRLYFPETGSTMLIQFDDVKLDNKGVPSRRGIVFPGAVPQEAGVREVIKLDKDCHD